MSSSRHQPTVYENYWEQRKHKLDEFSKTAQQIAERWRREADRVTSGYRDVEAEFLNAPWRKATDNAKDYGRISPVTTPEGHIAGHGSPEQTGGNSLQYAYQDEMHHPNSRAAVRASNRNRSAAKWKSQMNYTSDQVKRPKRSRSKTTPTDAPQRPLTTRYVPPSDRRQSEQYPEELRIPPTPSPIEYAISQRPFLRYTDYLQNRKDPTEQIPLHYSVPGRKFKTKATMTREKESKQFRMSIGNPQQIGPGWR
eukprot:gb/GECG01009573.1/.p1 GENE.gb/GECG01009573.1/~~gb/GECG01009573.1/.p1  ORF type:complete len:253 (+),score=33.97 gb/GECG01009573.1/:1-759(+)